MNKTIFKKNQVQQIKNKGYQNEHKIYQIYLKRYKELAFHGGTTEVVQSDDVHRPH